MSDKNIQQGDVGSKLAKGTSNPAIQVAREKSGVVKGASELNKSGGEDRKEGSERRQGETQQAENGVSTEVEGGDQTKEHKPAEVGEKRERENAPSPSTQTIEEGVSSGDQTATEKETKKPKLDTEGSKPVPSSTSAKAAPEKKGRGGKTQKAKAPAKPKAEPATKKRTSTRAKKGAVVVETQAIPQGVEQEVILNAIVDGTGMVGVEEKGTAIPPAQEALSGNT